MPQVCALVARARVHRSRALQGLGIEFARTARLRGGVPGSHGQGSVSGEFHQSFEAGACGDHGDSRAPSSCTSTRAPTRRRALIANG